MDREQQKLGQHLRQEIKARKAAEKATNDSLAAAAAATASDLAARATKSDASLAKLRERCQGLDKQQQRVQEQQVALVAEQTALQQVSTLQEQRDTGTCANLARLLTNLQALVCWLDLPRG